MLIDSKQKKKEYEASSHFPQNEMKMQEKLNMPYPKFQIQQQFHDVR
jgi:hypothetical protein